MRLLLATLVTVVAAAASAVELRAQTLPAGPIRAFDGKLTLSGQLVATAGAADDTAFFNYTDYENNALRMTRAALAAAWRPAEWVAFVAELRTEDFADLKAFGAYVRIRPFRSIPIKC